LILDCSSIGDIDYSASLNLEGLIAALHAEHRVFALADVDPRLMEVLTKLETLTHFDNAHIYSTVSEAVAAFRADTTTPAE
ncbi:MAG: STAS domain-containing protein, partial [Microbacterium sp.]